MKSLKTFDLPRFDYYARRIIIALVLAVCFIASQSIDRVLLTADAQQSDAEITDNVSNVAGISGTITFDNSPLLGATVILNGAESGMTTTNAAGFYSFSPTASGSYTVTASKSGIAFNPASQTANFSGAPTTVNFTGTGLCAPESANLISLFKGENTTGDFKGVNVGTFNGTATYATGKVGQAFSLNGASYVNVTNSVSLSPSSQVTLEAWVNPSANPNNAKIIDKRGSGSGYQLAFVSNQPSFTVGNTVLNGSAITINSWAHIVGTYDGASLRLYINGALVNTVGLNNGLVPNSLDLRLGSEMGNVNYFNGLLDEPQIYDRALTADEIALHYSAGAAGICTSNVIKPSSNGSLDTTFGTGGKVTTPIGTGGDTVRALAIQADGKIVAAGSAAVGADDFAVARYYTDGSLDTTFGVGGKVTTAVGASDDTGTAVVIQPDGKIVLGGYSYVGGNNDFSIVRYNTNGSLDTTFGSGGKVITAIGTSSDTARTMILQPDGKIILAGDSFTSSATNNDFALVRYNTDGSLDSSFGSSGKAVASIGYGDYLTGIALQPDGKVVAVGYQYDSSNAVGTELARFNSNGSLDSTFGSGGKVISTASAAGEFSTSVFIQPDGKIVASGTVSYTDFLTVRYNSNGSLDTTFGVGGRVTTNIGTYTRSNASALQPDGKIIVAGYYITGSAHYAVARYNANGSRDSTFGSNGVVTTTFNNYEDLIYAVKIQPDGKIIAAGYAGSNRDFSLARYGYGASSNYFSLNLNAALNFANATMPGSTTATALTSAQLPALPSNYSFASPLLAYDIRTSANYSGNVNVQIMVQSVASSPVCASLRLLHFENGAWSADTNAAPQYNSGMQTCTLTQTVSSLSPFAVAQVASPTAASVSISGRVIAPQEFGLTNALVTLTDSQGDTRTVRTGKFGSFRFTDVAAGETYILSVHSKRYTYAPQIITATGDLTEVNFSPQ